MSDTTTPMHHTAAVRLRQVALDCALDDLDSPATVDRVREGLAAVVETA